MKDLLDGLPEQPGYLEGERKRWVVLARLDRDYGVARDSQAPPKLCLAPLPLRSQHLQPVLQWSTRVKLAYLNVR